MRTVDDLDLSIADYPLREVERAPKSWARQHRIRLIIVGVAVLVGLVARVYRLDSASLAEDESSKIFALRAYAYGDFTVNAEHPMLMKLMCYGSVRAGEGWNALLGEATGLRVSQETALRLPNALFGALTVIPLFFLATALLGFRIGLATAALWALGIDAIWFNRIAKEETLLVFFMYAGYALYSRAKRHPEADARGAHRYFALAGLAFGLMLASKYCPQFLALNSIYYTLVGYDSRNNRPVGRRGWACMFGALIAGFVLANPALYAPQTWRYLWRYLSEEMLTHHGYLLMDTLFINDMGQTPGGNPWYFYLLFVLVKLPLPLIAVFLIGLVEIFRHRGFYPHSRGYLFLRLMLVFWLLPMSLVGTKFLRYALVLMPLVYMVAAIGIVVLWRWVTAAIGRFATDWMLARRVAAVTVAVIFVALPSAIAVRVLLNSHPGLYVNQLGGGKVGYFFPHDEFYDLGARESIRYVAETAPAGARLASEIPAVVDYYLEKYGRTDIKSEILSRPEFSISTDVPQYVLLQRGRTYIENIDAFRFIEANWQLVQSSNHDGVPASRVFASGFPRGEARAGPPGYQSDEKIDRQR
jgi:hypothetical protein